MLQENQWCHNVLRSAFDHFAFCHFYYEALTWYSVPGSSSRWICSPHQTPFRYTSLGCSAGKEVHTCHISGCFCFALLLFQPVSQPTLMQPMMEVVRAELYCVLSMMEYIKTKLQNRESKVGRCFPCWYKEALNSRARLSYPMTQESTNCTRNIRSDQPLNADACKPTTHRGKAVSTQLFKRPTCGRVLKLLTVCRSPE